MHMFQFERLPGNLKGAVMLMFAAAGFVVMAALIKLAGENLHVVQILLVRQVGMLLLLAPSLLSDFPQAFRTKELPLQFARIVFALIAMLCGFTAIIHMPLADATAIGFAKSFFVTIFAVIFLSELVGVHRWGAVIVGFLGVLVMLRPGSETFTIYSIYALIGAAAAGLVMVIIRKLTRVDSPRTILLYQAFGVAVIMILPAIWYWQAATLREWVIMGLIGIVSYLAQRANIMAYKWGEASLMACLEYMRLIYATLLGFWIFGQLPDLWTWLGALVIAAASLYTVLREVRLKRAVNTDAKSRSLINH